MGEAGRGRKGSEKTFGDNVYIYFLDFGDGVMNTYICQNLSNCALFKSVLYCMSVVA